MTEKKDYVEIKMVFIAYEGYNILLGSPFQSSSDDPDWTPFF